MAEEYSVATGIKVSHAAIVNHFGKLGTPRDLSAKVRAKADALVNTSLVTGKVTPEPFKGEAKLVEGVAVVQAGVRLTHRVDISRARRLAMTLLVELEEQTADRKTYNDIGTPQRIDGVKKLADTLKTLVGLEREAYSLDSAPDLDKPVVDKIRVTFIRPDGSRVGG